VTYLRSNAKFKTVGGIEVSDCGDEEMEESGSGRLFKQQSRRSVLARRQDREGPEDVREARLLD
jgi:hypothetical protein